MSDIGELSLIVALHQAPWRTELKRLLQSEAGFVLVAECATGAEAARLAERYRPDVLLLGLSMPDGSGFAALRRITASELGVQTVGMSPSADTATLLNALSLGARAVIPRGAPRARVIESIRTVARGDYSIAADQMGLIIDALKTPRLAADTAPQPPKAEARELFRLTRRELEIVEAITIGESNREIADRLALKECTVKHHVASVFDKLGVFSRLQLALFAINHHLVNFTEFLP